MVERVRQYLAIVRKGTLAATDEADLERIYMEALREAPNHRLVQLHEMTLHGVSFNLAEQLRDLLAEEIAALDPISLPEELR